MFLHNLLIILFLMKIRVDNPREELMCVERQERPKIKVQDCSKDD